MIQSSLAVLAIVPFFKFLFYTNYVLCAYQPTASPVFDTHFPSPSQRYFLIL